VLRLPDHWVWDSWYIHDGSQYHAFYLRASRALLDPVRRHHRASIGHAVSADLRQWTVWPDALVHSDGPAWDDLATWTGSVVRGPDGHWHLFYTGAARAEQGRVQRIGQAMSADLVTWHRSDQPVLEPDPRWYETLDAVGSGEEVSWRDPWVLPDPDGDGWHMLITARAPTGDPLDRGVIGHARSDDLMSWTVEPPLTEPAGFRWLEVPQVAVVDDQSLLLFSCVPQDVAERRRAVAAAGSVWAAPGDWVLGRYDLEAARPFSDPTLYAGRLIGDVAGGWSLMGFRNIDDGRFHGELTDPVSVVYDPIHGLHTAPRPSVVPAGAPDPINEPGGASHG
jgi:beta-fructofuranosidase